MEPFASLSRALEDSGRAQPSLVIDAQRLNGNLETLKQRALGQQLMTIPAGSNIEVDDWAYFRPTQSEAVLLQFGSLQIAREGRLVDTWPVLQN